MNSVISAVEADALDAETQRIRRLQQHVNINKTVRHLMAWHPLHVEPTRLRS
jgi:hypothetical protein